MPAEIEVTSKRIRAFEADVPTTLRNKTATLARTYHNVNVSGHVYQDLLSQESLLERCKEHVARKRGTVYRPEEARKAARDSRGLPVSTVVDLPTAFWQGATARAAAQRTVSAVGLALTADALRVMGPEGMARWGNHPLAVVLRAALPLRVAAWPAVLWNQNLAVQMLGSWAGPLLSTTIGSGLAEYIIGTGYSDHPDAPQVSPGYMVVAPPAYEVFKAHGFLGLPERGLVRAAALLLGDEAAEGSTLRQLGARACLLGAIGLRAANQAFRLPLCAVWCCELLLGGLVGSAHVLGNHTMQLIVLFAQQLGAAVGLATAPSRPMWRSLEGFDHVAGPEAHRAAQNQQQALESQMSSRASSPQDRLVADLGTTDASDGAQGTLEKSQGVQALALDVESQPRPNKRPWHLLRARHTLGSLPPALEKPGLQHGQRFEQI